MCKFWICSFILSVGVVGILSDSVIDFASNTLEFIDQVQSKLKLTNDPNIILVVGNTGSGKSKLVHYVAGDFSKMISKESNNPNSINFEIEDGLDVQSDVITSATESRTFIPELVVDEEQYAWYDCPGYDDTRNETMEIANTFLIRSVIESASRVKIVLVVDYDSVTDSRRDFNQMLSRTVQLLKRVNKFENSISLVVTKAPPRGKRYVEIFESSVKNTSVQFISDHRKVLLRSGMNEKKVLLIDALLKTGPNEDYPRISVFWRPDDVGAFDKLGKLVRGRHFIRESILRHTSYTIVQPDDFGFPLSAEAQLHVRSMVEQQVDNISAKLRNVTDRLQEAFDKRIESEGKLELPEHVRSNFRKMFDRIELGLFRLQYPPRSESVSLRKLTDRFRGIIEGSSLRSIDVAELTRIERDENNLNTLESILKGAAVNSSEALEVNHSVKIDYRSFLDEINNFFSKRETEIQGVLMNEAQQIIQNVNEDLKNIDTGLLTEIKGRLEQTRGFHDKLRLLQLGKRSIASSTVRTFEQRKKQFSGLIRVLNITAVSANDLNRIEQHILHLKALKSMSKKEIIGPVGDWIVNSSNTINCLSTEYAWYSFLSQVYGFLASYDVQKNVNAYNVANLSDWGTPNRLQGFLATSDNFNELCRLLKTTLQFESTPLRLNDLNQIIKTTIKSPPNHNCTDEVMTIEGIFVRSSDIKLSNCPSIKTLKRLNVFVVDRFYVDSDLNLNGFENVELYILANRWTIVQPATFHLNGFNGTSLTTPPTTNGTAGKPGDPGMNSGNFFGAANEVVNGGSLTVELIGGNGGDGQDGTGNQDVEVGEKEEASEDPRYAGTYKIYPSDYWTKSIKFESGSYVKEFDGENAALMNSTLSHLLEKEIKFTRKVFSGHCCGVTGTGGSGGRGGESGYYEFIHTGNNTANLPKKIRKKGINGRKGQNGRLCKTTGLIINGTCEYYGFDEKGNLIMMNTKKSYKTIDDPHCPDKYASSTEIVPNQPGDLYVAHTIIEYKRFLRGNMGNAMLFQIIQKTNDAILPNWKI